MADPVKPGEPNSWLYVPVSNYGFIIDDVTGREIASDVRDDVAPLLVAAPEMLALLHEARERGDAPPPAAWTDAVDGLLARLSKEGGGG